MPFGLKNVGATYQRAMATIFHDMLHREIEDYVDDIVVKSKATANHFHVLRRVFKRCRLYKLRRIPLNVLLVFSLESFWVSLFTNKGYMLILVRYKL